MPGTILRTGDRAANKTVFALMELTFPWRETICKQLNIKVSFVKWCWMLQKIF